MSVGLVLQDQSVPFRLGLLSKPVALISELSTFSRCRYLYRHACCPF
jgi:hypothetical protein